MKTLKPRKSLLFSIRLIITDLICKLQQKFDYIFFVVCYMPTFGILLMLHVLESFYLFFVPFQKALISLQT
jgi:hypothetical protein